MSSLIETKRQLAKNGTNRASVLLHCETNTFVNSIFNLVVLKLGDERHICLSEIFSLLNPKPPRRYGLGLVVFIPFQQCALLSLIFTQPFNPVIQPLAIFRPPS